MANISQIKLPDGSLYDLQDARVSIASTATAGIVKPDGDTISIDENGTLTSSITTWYGTCSTGSTTAAKVVTCDNFQLKAGSLIGIYFSNANSANVPTLNINQTGTKSIYVGGTGTTSTNRLTWSAYSILYFIYDGTYFRYITSSASISTDAVEGSRVWYCQSTTSAGTAAKTANPVYTNTYNPRNGDIVTVYFSTANTVEDAITLNITSYGAKDVYVNNAVTSASNPLLWKSGSRMQFLYNNSKYYYLGKDLTVGYDKTSLNSPTMSLDSNGRIQIEDFRISSSETSTAVIPNDTATNTVTFTSNDTTTALSSGWTEVNTLSSSETHASLFNKISTMFKNIRALWNYINNNIYKDGDVESWTYSGNSASLSIPIVVTSSAKDMFFTIYTPKSMENIGIIELTAFTGGIRSASGGYLNGSSDTYDWLSDATLSNIVYRKINNYTLLVRMVFSTALTNVTNNTPAIGLFTNVQLTFEEEVEEVDVY